MSERHGSRLHHVLYHTGILWLPTRVVLWLAVWTLTLDVLAPVGLVESGVRAVLIGLVVTWCCHRFVLHTLWVKVTKRRLLRIPPVLNEDGQVSVPIMLPGETLAIARDFTGEPMAGAVVRRDGSIRVEADWTHRA